MSYILEALHRADAERQLRGSGVPDLNTRHDTKPKSAPGRFAWIVAAVLAVNLVLLLLLWQRDDPTPPSTEAEPVQGVARPPAAVATTAGDGTATSAPQAATMPPPPAASTQPEPGPAELLGSSPATLPATAGPREPSAATPAGPREPTTRAVTSTPSVPVAVPTRPEPRPEIAAAPAPRIKQPGTRPPVQQADDAVDWRDLPSSERRDLPQPRLDVHVHAELPARRFVMIDMVRYGEGETLPGNVLLESITAEGVILDFNGRRYRLPRR